MVTFSTLSPHNQRELGRLMVSLRANDQRLDLLLAVCDHPDLRDRLIQHYENLLQTEGFATYRAKLNPKEPSLKETLAELVQYNPALQQGKKSVVTVLGAAELFGVKLSDDKSEQEKFFFSLQWTREALREFEFPVVIWLSDPVATGVARQAEDFWSWRSGVFEFEAESLPGKTLPMQQVQEMARSVEPSQTTDESASSIADLEQQIKELQQQNPKSPLLTTLYNDLGNALRQQKHHEPALTAYEAALRQANHHKDKRQEAEVFLNIGQTLQDCRRYDKAQHFFERALELFQALKASDREAHADYCLGHVTFDQRQFEAAKTHFQNALALYVERDDQANQARTYHMLGMVAQKLREYEQARSHYQQALDIKIESNDRYSQASTYGQLGLLAEAQEDYAQAQQRLQQALEIFAEFNDQHSVEITLQNLARLYQTTQDEGIVTDVAQCLNTTAEAVQQRFEEGDDDG